MEATVDRLWPDLFFGPINLWSAPWLGRPYHCIVPREPAETVREPKPNPVFDKVAAITSQRNFG